MRDRTYSIITLDSILDEIEQAGQMALSENEYKIALSCTTSKTNLLSNCWSWNVGKIEKMIH